MWSLRAIATILMVSRSEISHSEEKAYSSSSSNMSGKCCSGVNCEIYPKTSLECCGTILYHSTKQICCNGTVYDIKTKFECSGTEYFNPNDWTLLSVVISGYQQERFFPPLPAATKSAI